MNILEQLTVAAPGSVAAAQVQRIDDNGVVWVRVGENNLIPCDVLRSGPQPLVLQIGDRVLAMLPGETGLPGESDQRGCVLGVIEAYRGATPATGSTSGQSAPRTTTQETALSTAEIELPQGVLSEERDDSGARRLVLRCGKSSLAMQSDGKILLKGVDIVTRAKRLNKVKGGSVHIN